MTEIYKGNYEQAIAATSKVLAIRGKVYPSTTQNVTLLGEMEDGSIIEGETQIADHACPSSGCTCGLKTPSRCRKPWKRSAWPMPSSWGRAASITSVIPNLLVDGIADAIDRSKAVKIYVCNVMTQPGETDNYTASDHVRALMQHAPGKRLINYVLINKEPPGQAILERYEKYGQRFVTPDADAIRALGLTPIAVNLISQTDIVRHDPAHLAEAIYRIIL